MHDATAVSHLPLEAVIHPSLRGETIKPNLKMDLSSYEFRAYRNGAGFIVMHLRSTLLIFTSGAFSVTGYMHDIYGSLQLPEQNPIALEEFSISEAAAFPYDGTVLAVDLWVPVRTKLRSVAACTADLYLQVDFNIHGAPFRGIVHRLGTVVPRFRQIR